MFDRQFEDVTSFGPLSWQSRLFREYFALGRIPDAVDIPTGLGKTAVMALWLIARANGASLPRRLVYVVDRRAVVDQATDFAIKLRERLDSRAVYLKAGLGLNHCSLPISTLRGQYADNRAWLEDPASAAIIVGTVDMVGSRLLFEGYGVSRKMRPYHAGLLGADSLIVLDEAHLVPPFERLLEAIEGSDEYRALADPDKDAIPAFKLLSLSATGRDRTGSIFKLQGHLDAPAGSRGDLDDQTVVRRLVAEKIATLVSKTSEKLEDALAAQAWALADGGSAPIRCLVFSSSRGIAEKARQRVQQLAREDKTQKAGSGQIETELLVGARRVRERQNLMMDWLEAKGFLAGVNVELTRPAFLFATSAGEVGVDLDADHIICDLVAWERLVQRFGRVNRRGERSARIIIIDEGPPQPKEKGSPTPDEVAQLQRYSALLSLLQELPEKGNGSRLVSPEALRALKERAAGESALAATFRVATTTEPLRPALTRAMVDAWSMTSMEEHTGRPAVAPWLRGWVEEHPQTTVVWRKYLPVRMDMSTMKAEVEAYFEAAPPHLSEHLEAETFAVAEWFYERSVALLGAAKAVADQQSDSAAPAVEQGQSWRPERLSPGDTVALALSQSGQMADRFLLADFAIPKEDKTRKKELDRRLGRLAGMTLVVDARLGGLSMGLLDSDSTLRVETADGSDPWMPLDLDARQGTASSQSAVGFYVRASADDPANLSHGWHERYRFVLDWDVDGKPDRTLIVAKWRDDSANEEDRSIAAHYQLLSAHQAMTEAKMRSLAKRLGLCAELTEALALAAQLHDEGKKSNRWQRAFRAPRGKEPYAKTKGPIDFLLLDGYRHEFGSLTWVEKDASFAVLSEGLKDLVLHLVAAHHGQARPVIGTKSCEDAPPSLLQERARQVALRFARLQKQWGPWGLAWLESLMRAADQQASRENEEHKEQVTHGA